MRQLHLRDSYRGFDQPVFLKAQNAVRINNASWYEGMQFQMETLLLRIIRYLTQRRKKKNECKPSTS